MSRECDLLERTVVDLSEKRVLKVGTVCATEIVSATFGE